MKFVQYFLLLLIVVLLTACGNMLADDIKPPPDSVVSPAATAAPTEVVGSLFPLVQPDSSDGLEIYNDKCAPCHGVNGLGNGPRANELPNPVTAIGVKSIADSSIPTEWYQIITEGNLDKYMPPFSSLSERQRWDVLAHIYGLSQDFERINTGKALFQENCSQCHGVDGRGSGINSVDLSNLEYLVSNSTSEFYISITDGVQPNMPSFKDNLSDDERMNIADYLRSLTFILPDTLEEIAVENRENSASVAEIEDNPDEQDHSIEDTVNFGLGVISGSVLNGTNGEIPNGSTITLYGFDQMNQVFSDTVSVDPDGSFVFNDVEMPPERVFRTTFEHQGILYASDIATAHATEGMNLELPIVVYNATSDISNLFIDRLHIFLDQESADTLRVVELYVLSNIGNETVVAEDSDGVAVEYHLPEGATDLEIQDGLLGERFILTTSGFGDRVSIRPGMGNYQIVYTYLLPLESEVDLTHSIELASEAIVVLAPENLKIKGGDLNDDGIRDFQGEKFRMYSSEGLSPAQEISLKIAADQPLIPINISEDTTTGNLVIGMGVLGIVLMSAGVWFFFQNRKTDHTQDETVVDVNGGKVDKSDSQTIMDAIIALDDLYKEGGIPEVAYNERRQELKDQLKKSLE